MTNDAEQRLVERGISWEPGNERAKQEYAVLLHGALLDLLFEEVHAMRETGNV
jgi:hypothetical protein